MRVLMPIRWPVGGIRTYLRDLLKSRAFSDVAVEIVLPHHEEFVQLESEVERSDVRWHYAGRDTAVALAAAFFRRFARSRFDLVHSHGFIAASIAAAACRLRSRPHLITAHDVIVDANFRGNFLSLRRAILRRTLLSATRIHCVTKSAAENLVSFAPGLSSMSSIEVIEHGVDVARFRSGPVRNLREELGIGAHTTIFGFLGRFMEQKGFGCLVEAARLLARHHPVDRFRVVAIGYGGYIREEQNRIARTGLSDRFSFVPFMRDVAPFIRGVDCVVMPSLWEASGLVAMEAMVAGVPLIASQCVGLADSLVDTPARVVAPGDVQSLAEAMERELSDPGRKAAAAFADTAASRFDNGRSFARLRALYGRVIAAPG